MQGLLGWSGKLAPLARQPPVQQLLRHVRVAGVLLLLQGEGGQGVEGVVQRMKPVQDDAACEQARSGEEDAACEQARSGEEWRVARRHKGRLV